MSKNSPTSDSAGLRGWVCLRTAAQFLDMSPDALRRAVERHAVRASDGGIEAHIDGVRARKFGRQWRIAFSERWLPAQTP